MKKAVIASLMLTPLLIPMPHAEASGRMALPSLDRQTLAQMKSGTYKVPGGVKYGMTYKQAVKRTGRPSKEKLRRMSASNVTDLESTYRVKGGDVRLHFQGSAKASKSSLRLTNMTAYYAGSSVSESAVRKTLGKPVFTSLEGVTKYAGYSVAGRSHRSMTVEYRKVVRKSGGIKVTSWNVKRVSLTDYSR